MAAGRPHPPAPSTFAICRWARRAPADDGRVMPESRHTLRLRGQGDLLEAVPYLLGFHPSESLVLMGLDQVNSQSQVKVTLRMDLPDAERSAAIADAAAVLWRAAARAVVIVIYSSDRSLHADELPRRDFVADICRQLDRAGFAILDALLVSADQWWS